MPPEINPPNNLEIEQALKEFEVKSAGQQVPAIQAAPFSNDRPKMVRLVIKLSGGAIKEQKQAEYFLLGFVIVAVIISLFLVFGGKSNTPSVDIRDPSLSLPPI